MSSLQDISEIANSIAGEFEQHGLALDAVAAIPDLAGPLTVIAFVSPTDQDGEAPIVLALDEQADATQRDAALSAAQAAHGYLQAAEPTSISTMAEIEGTNAADLYSISANGTVIGVLFQQRDQQHVQDSSVSNPAGPPLTPGAPAQNSAATPTNGELTMLRDVVLEVTVELGRDSMTLAQMLGLTVGSVVELDRTAGSPVDIRVNGILFGRGEVVVVDDEYAVRIIEILESPGG